MNDTTERHREWGSWSALLYRGVIAVVFAVLIFTLPRMALGTLVLVFAAYATLDGILALAAALRARRVGLSRWPLYLEAIIGIVVGEAALGLAVGVRIFALAAVHNIALALILLLACRSFAMGIAELSGSAVRLRQGVSGAVMTWARMMNLVGTLSLAFGLVLLLTWGRVHFGTQLLITGVYFAAIGILFMVTAGALRQRTVVVAHS